MTIVNPYRIYQILNFNIMYHGRNAGFNKLTYHCKTATRCAVKTGPVGKNFFLGQTTFFLQYSREVFFSCSRKTGFYNIRWYLSTCWVLVCLILFFIKSMDLHIIGFPLGWDTHLWLADTVGIELQTKVALLDSFLLFFF